MDVKQANEYLGEMYQHLGKLDSEIESLEQCINSIQTRNQKNENQCCQLWLFIAKWAIFRPCELAIFGKNVGYSQLFGLFLGKVWLFRLFYNKLAIFRLWELATLVLKLFPIFIFRE